MQKVLTAAEMREVDRLTTEKYGIPSILLMENAAHAVARVITEKLGGSVKGKSILILCGKGNNGGDGAALARILWEQGARCFVYLIGKISDSTGDARTNFEIVQRLAETQTGFFNLSETFIGISELENIDRISEMFYVMKIDVCVDALFGTGFSGSMRAEFREVVRRFLNRKRPTSKDTIVVSVDIPSGINADSSWLGSDIPDDLVEEHVRVEDIARPDATVTFTAPKIANVSPPASRCNGDLTIAQIGTPSGLVEQSASQLYLSEASDAERFLRSSFFRNNSYKNKRGHSLIIAGSREFSGAAVLAGNSAMRSGVGLVTLVTAASSKDAAASRILPEVMVRGVAETESGAVAEDVFDEIADLLKKADSIAIGSGMSQNESTKRFVEKLVFGSSVPVVVDADALNLLSPWPPEGGTPNMILTPHEGEFSRLLGENHPDASFKEDRVAAVREFAQKHNVILVLKGERVLIGEPGGKVVVNPTGNSGLGKAGNGDTLTGIIAGFAAQAHAMNIDLFETVVAAVYIAGMAGDVAEKKFGKRVMTASDVRECLVEVFAQFDPNSISN